MTKPLALVIEDDPSLSEIFSLALQDSFSIETITDGNQALLRLAQVIPALVVLDLHLPGVSGMSIFRHIREDARLVSTRVMLCTADALQANILQDEADLVLLKPVSPAQLRLLASRLQAKR